MPLRIPFFRVWIVHASSGTKLNKSQNLQGNQKIGETDGASHGSGRVYHAYGIRVEQPGELETAIADALAHDGPVLIDAVVNRVELAIMPPTITAARAKGFTLYVLKAILNGQGSEIVESAKTNILR
jgi:hypothetical protein